jgi:pimeloyl-ACP methyl ester carboxylesterase
MLDGGMTITGVAGGVPYVALPPANDNGPAPLVAVWHLLDPPRGEEGMAEAVPMTGVPAWRVYFGLPMVNKRMHPGGMPEILRLAAEDYVLNIARPVVDQAVAEFPAALADVRKQLSIKDGPIGVAGGSMGGMVAYQVAARAEVPIVAVALVNPLTRLAQVVASEAVRQFTGREYVWTPESRAVADRFDFVRRADEIKVPLLIVQGEEDDVSFREPVAQVREALGARAELVTVPGMGHRIADEPSTGQNEHGRRVDAEFTRWFHNRWLSSTA